MLPRLRLFSLLAGLLVSPALSVFAEPLKITLPPKLAPTNEPFRMGTAVRPDGARLTVDGESLRLNGRAWIPVMGEYHYSRYPAAEWREELLKMKAGGIDIVATYVFWIHHEEVEGEWEWSGQRNLREFVRLCGEVGLKVIVRGGPWAHGEVRNGGLPDWVLNRAGGKVRTTDESFLKPVRVLYTQIAQQLKGLLWKEGGPVVGLQLDNEFAGPAEYLLALKTLAREVGLDVPLYTRTGWPQLTTPLPFGEIIPLYGAYAEGFWDRETTSMPGQYWLAYRFSKLRTDENIANEQLGRHEARDESEVARYPYLTCEVGGGMVPSYHRRVLSNPADVESTVLIKLGSGSTLPGYYMYHGGTNPEGKLTTLMETQATPATNWNDLPVKSYDFQAPLGEFGQVRPHYHLLRRLHLFLEDFGAALAGMPMTMPEIRPLGRDDINTLRWSVRSDGQSGFVFVNHYERGRSMPEQKAVQFALQLADGKSLVFPERAVDLPADARFIWPFNLDLGHGVRLRHATAQPICQIEEGKVRTVFFAQTAGVPSVFAIAGETALRTVGPSLNPAFTLAGSEGFKVRVVLLDEATSLTLYKMTWLGSPRLILSRANIVVDQDKIRVASPTLADVALKIFPAPKAFLRGSRAEGLFTPLRLKIPAMETPLVGLIKLRDAGTAREILLGKIAKPVAAEPTDADFEKAAVWRIKFPQNLDLSKTPLLRLHYSGDVARVTLDGKLLTDNFYNGVVFDIGLRRFAPGILHGDLQVAVLPLRQDAISGASPRIFVEESAKPDFAGNDVIAEISRADLISSYEGEVGPKPLR